MRRREFLGWGGGLLVSLVACSPQRGQPANDGHESDARIVFLTDVHAREERGAPEALDRAAQVINELKPDLIIGGGDYIHGGFKSDEETAAQRYAVFRRFRDKLNAPCQWMIGNHDLVGAVDEQGAIRSGDPREAFRREFNIDRLYRSFDFAGRHFIILDAIEVVGGEWGYRGFISEEQLKWLKSDLAAVAPGVPVVLLSHIPMRSVFMQVLYGATAALPSNLVIENANEVLACFENSQLEMVLQGHLHINERIYWNQTAFVMAGAVCGAWWGGNHRGTEEGFAVLNAERDCLTSHYHDYGWTPAPGTSSSPYN